MWTYCAWCDYVDRAHADDVYVQRVIYCRHKSWAWCTRTIKNISSREWLGDCKALRHGEMRSMHSAYLIREISTIISNNNNNDITLAYNTNASLVTCSYFGLSTWHWMFRMNVCETSNMRHTARAGVLLRQLSHCCCYFCFVVVTLNCKVSCKSLLSCVRHGKREEAGKPIIAIVAITLEPQMPHTIIIHILSRQTDRQTDR